MNNPDTRVNGFVFLTTALGGRPIYAFIWALWFGIVVMTTTGADLLRKETHPPGTMVAFTVGIIGTIVIGLRLVLFLKDKEQRRLLFSIDPRCATQKVSGFSRVAVMIAPVLGILAIAAIWIWR